jgi:hypothetical protein
LYPRPSANPSRHRNLEKIFKLALLHEFALFGRLAVIFKLDELLELGDRGIVRFMHRPGRMPLREGYFPAKLTKTTDASRAPFPLPRSGSVQRGHWSECGRAAFVGDSDAQRRPRRSVLVLGRTPMLHLRIIGIIWLAFGVLGVCASVFDLARNIASDAFASAIDSDFIALAFCVAAAFAGYGVFRHRRWARVVCGIVGVVLLLYTMSYLLMVGLEFGVFSYALIWAAAAFSIYSLFATVRYGRAA